MDTPPPEATTTVPMDLHQQMVRHAPTAIDNLDAHMVKSSHFVIAVFRHDSNINDAGNPEAFL